MEKQNSELMSGFSKFSKNNNYQQSINSTAVRYSIQICANIHPDICQKMVEI